MYGYVGQNPVGGIDPRGLFWFAAARLAIKVLTSKPVLIGLGATGLSKLLRPDLDNLDHAKAGVSAACGYGILKLALGLAATEVTMLEIAVVSGTVNAMANLYTDLVFLTRTKASDGTLLKGIIGTVLNIAPNILIGAISGVISKVLGGVGSPAVNIEVVSGFINLLSTAFNDRRNKIINKGVQVGLDSLSDSIYEYSKGNSSNSSNHSISPEVLKRNDFLDSIDSQDSLRESLDFVNY